MVTEFYIENVKCRGCKNMVIKEVKKQELVTGVEIDINTGKLTLHYSGDDETLARVKSRLYRKGYPEKGKNNKISTVKSYVSCAVGRMGSPAKLEIANYQTNKPV